MRRYLAVDNRVTCRSPLVSRFLIVLIGALAWAPAIAIGATVMDTSLEGGAPGATAIRNVTFESTGAVFSSAFSGIDYPDTLFPAEGTIEIVLRTTDPGAPETGMILDTRGALWRAPGDSVLVLAGTDNPEGASSGQVFFTIDPLGGRIPALSPGVTSSTAINDGDLHCIAVSYGSQGLEVWVDGVLEDSNPDVTTPLIRATVSLGDFDDSGRYNAGFSFTGGILRVRTSDVQSDVVLSDLCQHALCGDGITSDGSEQCDDGNTVDGDCCSSTCQFEPIGTTCREMIGVCDVAETCTGSSAICPSDTYAATATVCRASAGFCDLTETCTGLSPMCPADSKSVAACRISAGSCDVAETCDGIGNDCPIDSFVSIATICRVSAGVCDLAETCTGSSATCPADAKSSAECRSSVGVCDSAETCDGINNSCPADAFLPATTVCRGEASGCDAPEFCNGSTAACSADLKKLAGTTCSDDGNVCTDDQCDASGDCTHPPIPLAPLCDWVVVGGSDTERSTVRTRYNAQIYGSLCSDRADIGEATGIDVVLGTEESSLALVEDSGTAVKVRANAVIQNGRLVTAGGCVAGLQKSAIFGTVVEPICCDSSPVQLPGGVDGNVIDACGLDSLIDDCLASKAQVPADIATLDSLTSTQILGPVSIGPAGSKTILLEAGLNIIDMDKLRMNQNSTLTIDAQGKAGAVAVVRLARGLSTKLQAAIQLVGGATPENTLFYAVTGNCMVGWNNLGAGSLFCPQGKIRMHVDTEWVGSLAGGASIDIGWSSTLIHAPFLGFRQIGLSKH